MKKFLIIIFLSFLCLGCGKNITINVYENSDSEKVQITEENKSNNENSKVVKEITIIEKSNNSSNQNNDLDTSTKENSTLKTIKDKATDSYNSAKNWYDNNKDELKEINKEIMQDDIDTINSMADKTKTWYSENKDEIKDTAKDKYNEAKSALKDLFGKLKNNE